MRRGVQLLMFGVGATLGSGWAEMRVYTVCELLANPQSFNRKAVRVRGIVEGGTEGAWLESSDCPGKFYVGKRSLPNAISLSYQSEFGDAPPRNSAHIERVERQIKEKQRKMKSSVVTLTYSGVFETRTDWIASTSSTGDVQLMGFGHLNSFPAQLVVVDIGEPVVIEKR